MERLPITPIDTRKQTILKAVVNDYVLTAEPVGSQALVSRYQLGVKSATVRNELAELSDLGYLMQPHTSAGRVPSDMGYRFYVDRLMEAAGLTGEETRTAQGRLRPRMTEPEIILEQTCRILSEMSRYTSVATDPDLTENVIKHVSVADVSNNRSLVVVVLENGRVLHELIEPKPGRKTDPVNASNYLTEKLVGQTLKNVDGTALPEDPAEMRHLLETVCEFLKREVECWESTGIYLGPTSYIIQQPEFQEARRLEQVLSILEQRSLLYKLFSSMYLGPDVTVIIGRENPLNEMQDCSFVGTTYRIRGRVAGTLGVIGPTRMDYRRAVGAVQFMARNLGELLTQLSVG